MLDLPGEELGTSFFLLNFSRRSVRRVNFGLWGTDDTQTLTRSGFFDMDPAKHQDTEPVHVMYARP